MCVWGGGGMALYQNSKQIWRLSGRHCKSWYDAPTILSMLNPENYIHAQDSSYEYFKIVDVVSFKVIFRNFQDMYCK